MGLNFAGLGFSEGFARGILYKEVQEKLITGFVPSIKAYGKTIIDETFWDNKNILSGIAKEYLKNLFEGFIFDNLLRRHSY